MDPIATTAALTGEPARILSPAAVAGYDPEVVADYVPAAPEGTDVIGFPEDKQIVQGMDAAITGAFTFPAAELPPGLVPMFSQLEWRSKTVTIHLIRERRWLGAINGFTLFFSK